VKHYPKPFAFMLTQLRTDYHLTGKDLAAQLGISQQYLCDLEHEKRLPSVRVIKKICANSWLAHVTAKRAWHRAGAKAHGWEI
jgi:transcriptional regulator with XRE-family HTH domain